MDTSLSFIIANFHTELEPQVSVSQDMNSPAFKLYTTLWSNTQHILLWSDSTKIWSRKGSSGSCVDCTEVFLLLTHQKLYQIPEKNWYYFRNWGLGQLPPPWLCACFWSETWTLLEAKQLVRLSLHRYRVDLTTESKRRVLTWGPWT